MKIQLTLQEATQAIAEYVGKRSSIPCTAHDVTIWHDINDGALDDNCHIGFEVQIDAEPK